jgi:hypothetical protein
MTARKYRDKPIEYTARYVLAGKLPRSRIYSRKSLAQKIASLSQVLCHLRVIAESLRA